MPVGVQQWQWVLSVQSAWHCEHARLLLPNGDGDRQKLPRLAPTRTGFGSSCPLLPGRVPSSNMKRRWQINSGDVSAQFLMNVLLF